MAKLAIGTLGHSVFVLEDQPNPQVVKVTRTNPNDARPAEFFLPKELFVDFAAEYLAEKLKEFLR